MKLVIDTNILFSFFKSTSLTRKLIESQSFQLISPQLAIEEIKKYSEIIIKKTGISKSEFDFYLEELKRIVKFIDKKDYILFIDDAERIAPDKKDGDFFALCLKESCALWSNDQILKTQDKVNVFNTNEIIDLIF